jgi:glycerol uptake facilitator-like aquaporin
LFVKKIPAWFTGESFGTFLLVFFGCGSVCAVVTTGAQGARWLTFDSSAPLLGGGLENLFFKSSHAET